MPERPTPSYQISGDLAALGAQVRAEWRADEEMWAREAARRWAHGRRLCDVLREYAARGDRVSVDVAGWRFEGEVGAIGDDRFDLVGGAVDITIHTAVSGACGAPMVIRRAHRSRTGGRRVSPGPATFGARLRELEESGRRVRVGMSFTAEVTGTVVVGADHVSVCGDDEVVVPLAWVAYVAEAPEGVS